LPCRILALPDFPKSELISADPFGLCRFGNSEAATLKHGESGRSDGAATGLRGHYLRRSGSGGKPRCQMVPLSN
jgi:hypothetical protein